MAFLTPAEIASHLCGEVVQEIERHASNTTLLQQAIDAAIAEVQGYLSAYDTTAVFAATGAARNAIILLYTKDVAVWHYIQLANPAVEMQLRLERYEKAIDFLDKVQRGKVAPDLPLPPAPADGSGSTNFIKYGSNPKRGNYY